ncbi:MAG: putative metal-binding motif-containing protein [Myxococcota bacterium]|nr:putative metal-binding motif-containing protein [Myxococcota bacterium]
MNWKLIWLSLLATGCGTSIGTKNYDDDIPNDTDEVEDTAVEDTAIEDTATDIDDTDDTDDTDEETPSEENPNFGECDDDIDNDEDGLFDCEDDDCEGSSPCTDADGDGFSASEDCDDTDPDIYPGAFEIANDEIDQNCDGEDTTVGEDADGDGHYDFSDCDDTDPDVYPGAPGEIDDDGIDQDCDGYDNANSTVDNDFDGYYAYEDCDDNDMYAYPGAAHYDSNTDCMRDADYDGYGDDSPTNSNVIPGTDCDDDAWDVYPGSYDIPDDGIDQDCDGVSASTADDDLDGYNVNEDCDDTNPDINPGATDIPDDGIDQDCSGYDATDTDADSDGYDANHDCDEGDAAINPGAVEIANDGIDQDCDGVDLVGSCDIDSSVSGSGAAIFSSNTSPTINQTQGSCSFYDTTEYTIEWTASDSGCATVDTLNSQTDTVLSIFDTCPGYQGGTELDCNDETMNSFWGESEIQLDVVSGETYYIIIEGWYSTLTNATLNVTVDNTQSCGGTPLDQDGDGYPPSTDCDDNDASINPSATEIFADGIDQNCDGVEYCYIDIDQDGYGSSDDLDGDGLIDGIPSIDLDCTDLLESSTSDDCNDLSATVNPGASEILSDGIDQNCDGVIE